jgi:FHA domain-containing protein
MIEIVAVSYNGQPTPSEMRGEFGPAGGTLGRGSDNLLPLPDPARHVSRVQGRVRWDGKRFWIANVSDANPLFLNDEEIDSRKEAPLAPGDELRVGLYVLRVRELSRSAADARLSAPAGAPGAVPPPDVVPPARGLPGDSMAALLGVSPPSGDNPFADLLGGGGAPDLRAGTPSISARSSPDRGADPGVADNPFLPAQGPPPAATAPAVTPVAFDPQLMSDTSRSGDPFADLLGPGGGNPSRPPAPHADSAKSFPGGTIPDDFDPFVQPSALPNRNSDDPLRDLAASGIDLRAVQGEAGKSLVDFDPGRDAAPPDPLRSGTPSLVDPLEAVDPMKLFGGPDDRLVISNELANPIQAPMPDNLPELGAYFAPARSMEDPALARITAFDGPRVRIPDSPFPERQPPRMPESSPPGTEQRGHEALPGGGVPVIDNEPSASSPVASIVPAPVDVPPAPGSPALAPSVAPAPAPPGARPEVAPWGTAHVDALIAAFLEGAHAGSTTNPALVTPELMRNLGQLVYLAIAGAMGLMTARQITKREIGAERTMILGTGNNPLKFLPTPEAALMQIFGPKMPGFLGPAEAMEDAFADLRAHELGVIAGTRAAMTEAMRRFDPKVFEEQLGPGGPLEAILPGGRRGKLWLLFEARFNEICRQADDDFHSLYGKTFTAAYEEEVARHRSTHDGK